MAEVDLDPCQDCRGSGYTWTGVDETPEPCPTCGGTGLAAIWTRERPATKAVYTFRRGCYLLVDHGAEWCATVFPDGIRAEATPSPSPGVDALARRLHLSPWSRVWQHELIHTWLAEEMGLDHSPTLRAVADGWTSPPDGNGIRNEEAMTEAVHHLYVKGLLPALDAFILSPSWKGTEWET